MSKKNAMLLMAAVMIARGTSFLFSKHLMNSLAPMNVLAVRFILAFFILLLIFNKRLFSCSRKDLQKGMWLGLSYTACMIAEMYGLRLIDTGTSSFIENSAVVIVPLYEAILTRSLPKKNILVCAAIAFAGVGFLTVSGGSSLNIGILLAILAALIYGICVLLTKHFTQEGDPLCIGIYQLGFMGLFSALLTLIIDRPRLPESSSEWLMILMLSLVCSCFGFTLQPLAQKYISVETASVFTAVNPLSTCFIGVIFANESAGPMKLIGGLLIILAVILSIKNED